MTEKFLQLIGTIESCFIPIDLAGQANDGDWLALKNYRRALIVLFKEAGAAGEDPVFTLRQAQDASGTGAKALNFTTIYEKVGTLTSVTAWTRVVQALANTYTNAASAEAAALMAVEIEASMLDVNNGFEFFQLQIPDTGATAGQFGCGFAILFDPRYPQEALITAES